MKNLKKVLSLALAFAMVLGLCVTGMAAQDVTTLSDWDEVTDKDSAILLNAFSIMEGHEDEEGNPTVYDPDGDVTRAQAAAIISRAVWGGVDNVALYAAGNVGGYIDVIVGAWYMGYVNYMTVAGVMVGDGDGEFRPEDTVSGYEYLKMCLVALGYDAETEGLTGNGWDLRAMALATLRGQQNLTEGTTVTDWSAPLSRMNAATIAANMIFRNTVSYNDGKVVYGNTFGVDVLDMDHDEAILIANEYGDISDIVNANKATKLDPKTAKGNAYVYVTGEDAILTTLDSTLFDLGTPATVYYVDGEVLSVTLDGWTEVEQTKNAAGMPTNAEDTVTPYVWGPTDTYSEKTFIDVDGNGKYEIEVTLNYAMVDTVKEVKTEKEVTTVTMTNGYSFNAASSNITAEKDDVVTLGFTGGNIYNKGNYIFGHVLTGVEGKVTRLVTATAPSTKDTVYVDGVDYKAEQTLGIKFGTEGTFYTYPNGEIAIVIGDKPVTVDPVYAVIYDAGIETVGSTTGLSSSQSVIVEVVAILEDGTIGTYEVASFTTATDTFVLDGKSTTIKGEDNELNELKLDEVFDNANWDSDSAMFVEYTLTKDGKINLIAAELSEDLGTDVELDGKALVAPDTYSTANTISFIRTNKGEKTEKWAVVKGVIGAGKYTGEYNTDEYLSETTKQITYMVADFAATETTVEAPFFYVVSNLGQVGWDETDTSKEVYELVVYNADTNKVETVESTKNAAAKTYWADADLTVELVGAKGYITAIEGNVLALTAATEKAEDGTETKAAPVVFNVDEKASYYLIDGENTAEIEAADLSVQTVGSYKTGDEPTFKAILVDTDTTPDGDIDLVIVVK